MKVICIIIYYTRKNMDPTVENIIWETPNRENIVMTTTVEYNEIRVKFFVEQNHRRVPISFEAIKHIMPTIALITACSESMRELHFTSVAPEPAAPTPVPAASVYAPMLTTGRARSVAFASIPTFAPVRAAHASAYVSMLDSAPDADESDMEEIRKMDQIQKDLELAETLNLEFNA